MASNKEIANEFFLFSEILELKSGDRFKINAYQKAAQAIASIGISVHEMYRSGGIKEVEKIDGVGLGIASKIEEFIKDGKIKDLEILKKKFPAPEIEFLKIPGVGPKTARVLYEKLGAKNISELGTMLSQNGHKYFHEKSLKNIIRGTEIYKNMGNRMLLNEASDISELIISYLKDVTSATNITAVGSLRRRVETVGDIDIIASSKTPDNIIKKFVEFDQFTQIIAQGETKASAIFEGDVQVDLEILPKGKFGSLLVHFTGSKLHNIALRSYALKKGLSSSEHGIKHIKSKKIETFSNESGFYKRLGLEYIEPELREDRGEISASLEHKLPDLVEQKDIKGDLHIHSNYSDGTASIEQIVIKAIELNYQYVAISDHTVGLGIANGLSSKRFKERQKEIEKIRKKYSKIKILSSCEVNIKPDGRLDMPDDIMAVFDIVNASVHSSLSQDKDAITDRIITAIENKFVNIIGHPTGRILNERNGYEADWEAIFNACVKNNVALEINAYPDRLDLPDSLVFDARKAGVKFVISTDAHSLDQMNYMNFGVSVARRGWCEKSDILNSAPLEKFPKHN